VVLVGSERIDEHYDGADMPEADHMLIRAHLDCSMTFWIKVMDETLALRLCVREDGCIGLLALLWGSRLLQSQCSFGFGHVIVWVIVSL